MGSLGRSILEGLALDHHHHDHPYLQSEFSAFDLNDEMERWLAAEEESSHNAEGAVIDYSVLAVAVMTLAMILLVELLRHWIDHSARGRPFVMTVLEMVYSELSTLGIVELVLFIIMKYSKRILSHEKEEVFADVHFAFFYTAIFNGFGTVIAARAARSVSNRHWVQTEDLALDHYIEIREEFDRVHEQYCLDKNTYCGYLLPNAIRSLRHPGLRSRYIKLLVQVRYHELRLHFLEGNNLPLTFNVSHYLKRAERQVLMSLVHISGAAWMLLTGGFSLVYFILGMVAYKTGDPEIIGNCMAIIFFTILLLFNITCLALYVKMDSVFHQILSTKRIKGESASERESGMQVQRNLFWFGEPKHVISLVQFMQFGYAIALSIVLMYWADIGSQNIPPYTFLIVVLVSYCIFISVLSRVLPEFTLCTSLGHLVNQKHLHETLAEYKLEETKRKQRRQKMLECLDLDEPVGIQSTKKNNLDHTTSTGAKSSIASPDGSTHTPIRTLKHSEPSQRTQTFELLASLIMTDTNNLRGQLPESSRESSDHEKQSQEKEETYVEVSSPEQNATDETSPTVQDCSNYKTAESGNYADKLSDVDKVKQEYPGIRKHTNKVDNGSTKIFKNLSPTELKKRMRMWFLSNSYEISSQIFGTVVVFFLIGRRVEAMDEATGIYVSTTPKFDLSLSVCFWWEATWYMFFIVMDSMVLALFSHKWNPTKQERTLFVCAVLDMFLSVCCLALLFVAEAERCCVDEDYSGESRFLVEADQNVAHESSTHSEPEVNFLDECTCPFWGSRTYGGLGKIEPFTSLIGLRVLRFAIADFLVSKFSTEDDPTHKHDLSNTCNEDHSAEKHSQIHHGSHSHHDETGTIVQLWERALQQYPDIVQKYGQFSAELLQAMLGLEVVALPPPSSTEDATVTSPEVNAPNRSGMPISKDDSSRTVILNDQYGRLPAVCQKLIIAGRLGKPVKSGLCAGGLSTLHEESSSPTEPGVDNTERTLKPRPIIEFEIDSEQLVLEEALESTFIAPTARLIQSMRRCDRKFIPLLMEWVTVDVVMTQFEIVYFEAREELENGDTTTELLEKKAACKIALQATNGGKGLRLCDVAAGRKVVGRLDLSKITEIHVERAMPLDDNSLNDFGASADAIDQQLPSEYWLQKNQVYNHEHTRDLRWAKVKEDRLKLVSLSGSLLLRFYSDLDDIELHPDVTENEYEGPLKKDIAFQWAHILVRICGVDQLKQSLPHFGENNSDELRDYLQVVHHSKTSHVHHTAKSDENQKKGKRWGTVKAAVAMKSGQK